MKLRFDWAHGLRAQISDGEVRFVGSPMALAYAGAMTARDRADVLAKSLIKAQVELAELEPSPEARDDTGDV